MTMINLLTSSIDDAGQSSSRYEPGRKFWYGKSSDASYQHELFDEGLPGFYDPLLLPVIDSPSGLATFLESEFQPCFLWSSLPENDSSANLSSDYPKKS